MHGTPNIQIVRHLLGLTLFGSCKLFPVDLACPNILFAKSVCWIRVSFNFFKNLHHQNKVRWKNCSWLPD